MQGLCAVMPCYVNYWYKDGKLPEHTKASFKEYAVLSFHNIIAMNGLVFLHKVYHFPQSLPSSIILTIPVNTPKPGYDYDECHEWSQRFNNIPYRSNFFHKGPLFAISCEPICDKYPIAILYNLWSKIQYGRHFLAVFWP